MIKKTFQFTGFVLLVLAILGVAPAVAQAPTLDSVQINHLDASVPAQAEAHVSVLQGDQPVTGLPPEAFAVYVDDVKLTEGVTVEPTAPGLAVMVLVDISSSMDEPGILTDRRLTDAQQLAQSFVQQLSEDDWVGLIGFGADLVPVENLTYDHGKILNTLAQLPQTAGPVGAEQRGFTHLFDGVVEAMDKLTNNTDPDVRNQTAAMRKIVLVLSDGNDTQSSVTRLDAQRAANDANISVYTASLCSPAGQGLARLKCSSDDVRWLSSRTNGESLMLEQAGDQAEIEALYGRLGEQHNQYNVAYEWHAPRGPHKCRIEVSSGGAVQSDEVDCFSKILQPEVEIVTPSDGARFSRAEAQAGPVPINVAVTFPDEAPRTPDKIEYLVNGQPYSTTVRPPADAPPTVLLDLQDLAGGDYTLLGILHDPFTLERSDSSEKRLVTISVAPWLSPTLTLSVPITEVVTSAGATVSMTVDAVFPDAVPRELTVRVRDEGGQGIIAETTGLPPFLVSWPVENAKHGEHLLVADAYDPKTGTTQRSNELTVTLPPTPAQSIWDWLLHNWYWLLLFLIVLVLILFLWRRKPAFIAPVTTQIKQLTTRLSSNPARAKLVTLRGPHMGEYPIRDQMTYVGRDADQCGLVIQGDGSISNVHAVIQIDPRGLFFVKDLSRNGTFINNSYQPVQRDPNWTPLNDGDILFLGQTQLQFRELGKKTAVLPKVP